jgi:nucleotide-binding universal stress UspA family protein
VRHGLRVEVAQVPRLGASAGAAILREAQEQGAALLVAGGYGHTRAREFVMGGVTRTLFEQAQLPVLFSH